MSDSRSARSACTTQDIARFCAADPAELVVSSFLCPFCIDVRVTAVVTELCSRGGGAVVCECSGCKAVWTLGLNNEQLLRLALAPPPRAGEWWTLVLRFDEWCW